MSDVPTARTTMRAFRAEAMASIWLLAFLGGCASTWYYDQDAELQYPDWLLSGERLFDAPVPAAAGPGMAIAEPSPEMRAYVASLVGAVRAPAGRFRALFGGLVRDGYFHSVYSANQTLTAAETFVERGGNCLSYTNMFIALAREAGLQASYQIVDVPPSWDADADFLIRYTHINVLLKNLRLEPGAQPQVIVDFNVVHPEDDYRRREVSDAYADGLFHANISISLLRDGLVKESFAHLRRALEIAPSNLDLWINLGAFYANQGDYEGAMAAYQVALQLNPNSRPAFSGLARSYANAGNEAQAAFYEQKVRNYRETNPYYHFAMAQAAYERSQFEESLAYVNAAIGLKRRAPKFYLLRALVEHQLGQPEAAAASLRRAQRFGLEQGDKAELLRSMGTASL
jgi:Flp pilus assembly protein TadD